MSNLLIPIIAEGFLDGTSSFTCQSGFIDRALKLYKDLRIVCERREFDNAADRIVRVVFRVQGNWWNGAR